jgi:hypothetical protein
VGEQRFARANGDGMDLQHVFVDEAEPGEPLCGAPAARHAEVAAGLPLEFGDGGDQVVIVAGDDQLRVIPRQVNGLVGDDNAVQPVDGGGEVTARL